MSSERKVTANRSNGRRSSGPRTNAGKTRASCNALQHGLAVIMHDRSIPSGEVACFAKALCGDDSDPALLAQAQVIVQNEMVLRAIREQQIALVERLRDPTAIALTKRDNSLTNDASPASLRNIGIGLNLKISTRAPTTSSHWVSKCFSRNRIR